MQQDIGLAPRECARNSGAFILIRMFLGFLVYLTLGTIFPIPGEIMLTNILVIKSNLFLLIGIIIAIFFIALFDLIVGFPLYNVTNSINKRIASEMRSLRILEALAFVIGISLLFLEFPLAHQVLAIALVPYGLHLIELGRLVYMSGYLNKYLGLSLMSGGSVGYLTFSTTIILFPSLNWLSVIGVYIAIISEIVLAITFIAKSRKILETDPVETITTILNNIGEATTKEITEEAAKISAECPDRVPQTLRALEMENKVAKKLSKEKRGYVWSLVES